MEHLFGRRLPGWPDRAATVAVYEEATGRPVGRPRLVRDLGHGPQHGADDPAGLPAPGRRGARRCCPIDDNPLLDLLRGPT